MEYSKTINKDIVFHPLDIRPGTMCEVKITLIVSETFTWNSNENFVHTINGYIIRESVKFNKSVNPSYVQIVENEDDTTTIIINSVNFGIVDITLNYYIRESLYIKSKSAFSSKYATHYKDYVIENNKIIPMTIIEIPEYTDNMAVYKIEVIPEIETGGIDFFNGIRIDINSCGLLTYNDEKKYILKKGREIARVPLDSDLPFSKIEGMYKLVEIENQEWKEGYNKSAGILVYNKNLLVLTNKSLCVFDIIGDDFDNFILEDESIIGNDLTCLSDDSILLSSGNKLYKYKIRHNKLFLDKINKKLLFREINPQITFS